jgi:hypothetical protein
MDFTVTYWEHRKREATASEQDVTDALQAYIKVRPGGELPALYHANRASIVITQLAQGFTPDDTGIIAVALAEYAWDHDAAAIIARDENSDYTATVKP